MVLLLCIILLRGKDVKNGGKFASGNGGIQQPFCLRFDKMDAGGMNVKKIIKQTILAAWMGLVLPGMALTLAVKQPRDNGDTTQPADQQTQPGTSAVQTEGTVQPLQIAVLMEDGTVQQMDMDEYLTGVVLAEMPASFDIEAQKAQAVVARTYALRRSTVSVKHEQNAVCTEASCCQGYISPQRYAQSGGSESGIEQIRQAVQQTSGQVLTYDGQLIEATYFSCSGGSTEDAAAVWGTDIPYLQSTDSPGEEDAAHFEDSVFFSSSEFASRLGTSLWGSPDTWLGEVTYTDGGGVDTMEIGGEVYGGTQLRSLLGLRSTVFSMSAEADGILVYTRGYGHRVGMSQYGAEAMAVAGSRYDEILTHYYSGVVLQQYDPGD